MAEPFEILEAALLSLPANGRQRLLRSLVRSLDPEARGEGSGEKGRMALNQHMEEWRAGRLEALPLDVARAVIRERCVPPAADAPPREPA